MGRLFGTDGIRGIANTELSGQLAANVAKAAVISLNAGASNNNKNTEKIKVIIGTDTRISGGMLCSAVASAICSVGADVVMLGVLPTPAIAYLLGIGCADMGIMITASHNPYNFNGLKIYNQGGLKLTDEQEKSIEEIVFDACYEYPVIWGDMVGQIDHKPELLGQYIEFVKSAAKGENLNGIRAVFDCSNGSACSTAARIFTELGLDATFIGNRPNGVNINEKSGSTHIKYLSNFIKSGEYDIGFAFDGDADRCLMTDENGKILDGDVILSVLANALSQEGNLAKNTFVATNMSNLGLHEFAKNYSHDLRITGVGDRYVLEEMLANGYNLGGEQSGHIVLADFLSTGDGQLTAVALLVALLKSGKKMSELSSIISIYPQRLVSFRADENMKKALNSDKIAKELVEKVAAQLGDQGRVLVRASGTEPLIRVMIEGKDEAMVEGLTAELASDLEERLALNQSLGPLC